MPRAAALLLPLLLCACAGGRTNKLPQDGAVKPHDGDWTLGDWLTPPGKDAGKDKGKPADKGKPTDKAAPKKDSKPSPVGLEAVVNKILLPNSGTAYAIDLDGNGTKDNQIGVIMGAIKILGGANFNLQADLDLQLAEGKVLMLFRLQSKSLVTDPSVSLRLYDGRDLDNNPKDNFSGAEPFSIDKTGPMNLLLGGQVNVGVLNAGPGNLSAPIPMGGVVTSVSLRLSRLSALVSSKGMTKGQIHGAIPMSDVNSKILPSLATDLDKTWKKTTDPGKKKVIAAFDTDGNGTITATDLQKNALVGMIIAPDVDTNGDKNPDAMSLGIGFTAVRCKIK